MDSLLKRAPKPTSKAPRMMSAIPTLSGPPIFFFFLFGGGGEAEVAGLLSTI